MTQRASHPPIEPVRRRVALAVLLALLGVLAVIVLHPHGLRHWIERASAPDGLAPAGAAWDRTIDGADVARKQIAVDLKKVASGIEQPTDIQFPPGVDARAIVLQKTGDALWLDVASGKHGKLFDVDVLTAVEEGLLGLAFHPRFKENGRIFLNYVASLNGKDTSVIAEWKLTGGSDLRHAHAEPVHILTAVEQPYPNHNGGQLVFGPDGYLYIGFGDGGARDDPHGNGQRSDTMLGKMLRIDVDPKFAERAPDDHSRHGLYGVPSDNPFVGKGWLSEIWAYGLRNPWRYSFDPQGRLIIADVGQDTWEEIDIAAAGDNLGWKIKEGFACYRGSEAECKRKDLVDPILVYGRQDGNSITGGFVYTGSRIAALRGLYVFGDFGSGRLFAIELPSDRKTRIEQPIALGRWPFHPSTFGRDASGELYVASFGAGEIYKLVPKNKN
jgi:glucose/arabinose dehydrogenase